MHPRTVASQAVKGVTTRIPHLGAWPPLHAAAPILPHLATVPDPSGNFNHVFDH